VRRTTVDAHGTRGQCALEVYLVEIARTDPETGARQRAALERPCVEAYAFTYLSDVRCSRGWLAADPGPERFRRLLTEQLFPSDPRQRSN
jgi:hypothetical protein